MNLSTPTSPVLVGGLALSRIGYDRYIRFIAPYMAILFVSIGLGVIIGGQVDPVAATTVPEATPTP